MNYTLGKGIQEAQQMIFEAVGSDNDKYLNWIKKSRWEFYQYLERLNESVKKIESKS